MKRPHFARLSVPFAALLGLAGNSFGCLEDEGTPNASAGSGGAGVNAGGSTSGAAGSSGGGASGGGAGGTAGNPETPLLPAQCEGIRNNMACPLVGTCAQRACGLADLGSRDCVCNGTWSCSSCAFPMGSDRPSVLEPPTSGDADAGDAGDAASGGLRTCEAEVDDEVVCSPQGDRCYKGDEVCACWLTDDDGAYIWDCDAPPSFWP